MNGKGGCIFSQEFIFRSGKPQYCETLNPGSRTLGKCSTTELYPGPSEIYTYCLSALPSLALPIPGHGHPWVTKQKGHCKAGAQHLQAARLSSSRDANSGLSRASCPLQLSVFSWPRGADKGKMSIGWLVAQTAWCGCSSSWSQRTGHSQCPRPFLDLCLS